jgi:hypothetical protein
MAGGRARAGISLLIALALSARRRFPDAFRRYVYYDEYTRARYGAVRTKDFEHFEPFTDSLHAPRMRHGSAFLAPQSVLRGLQALDSGNRPN